MTYNWFGLQYPRSGTIYFFPFDRKVSFAFGIPIFAKVERETAFFIANGNIRVVKSVAISIYLVLNEKAIRLSIIANELLNKTQS